MLHTYTGKNRCARAIAGHLRLGTGLHVGLGPIRACAQPHLADSWAFFPDADMQHQGQPSIDA